MKTIATLMGALIVIGSTFAQASQTCTNFSGYWRGTCVSNSGKYRQDETRINQPNCNVIDIDGRMLVFGQTIQTPTYDGGVVYEKIEQNQCGEMNYSYLWLINNPFNNGQITKLSTQVNYSIRNGQFIRTNKDNLSGFAETCTFSRF